MLEYAGSLAEGPTTWHHALQYYARCPQGGRHAAEALIQVTSWRALGHGCVLHAVQCKTKIQESHGGARGRALLVFDAHEIMFSVDRSPGDWGLQGRR